MATHSPKPRRNKPDSLAADTISGHVYATNEIMRHAAEAAGYQVTAVIVRKPLGRFREGGR